MPALDLTMTDAPGMQLCTPLVAGQEAGATGLAGGQVLTAANIIH